MKTVLIGAALCALALILVAIGRFHAGNSVGELSAYTQSQLDKILKEGYQYAVMCDQDQNPVIALMHCCAALNYLDTVQQVASASWAQKTLGSDIEHFRKALAERLNFIIASIGKACPKLAVNSQYSPWAGWKFT